MGSLLLAVAALTASTDFEEAPRLVPQIEEDYPAGSEEFAMLFGAGCSLGCAMDWSYAVTSTLRSQGDNSYGIGNVDDTDPATAWVEGVEGWGIGESIAVEFQDYPGTSYTEESHGINFSGMTIQNGYAKDEETWRANGRVHELALYLNGNLMGILDLADVMAAQTIYWAPAHYELRSGDVLRMQILSVYEGDLYEDTAISGVMFWGAH